MKKTSTNTNRGSRPNSSRRKRPQRLWEMTIPVLSTAHIKETTLDALAAGSPERLALYPEGAFVRIQAGKFADIPELLPIAAWFRKHYPEEHWLRLDPDGDVIKGLPTFEW
jgi:hypothetical protein